jgi:hypothetical protein
MRRVLLICAVLLASPYLASSPASAAGLRAPSCDALVAFAFGARMALVEVSFGKAPEAMTVDEFDQAIDVVSVCVDEIANGPADVPGLTLRERKRARINALTSLLEDFKIYRSRARERERRAAERRD